MLPVVAQTRSTEYSDFSSDEECSFTSLLVNLTPFVLQSRCWGLTTHVPSNLPPKRDCGPKKVKQTKKRLSPLSCWSDNTGTSAATGTTQRIATLVAPLVPSVRRDFTGSAEGSRYSSTGAIKGPLRRWYCSGGGIAEGGEGLPASHSQKRNFGPLRGPFSPPCSRILPQISRSPRTQEPTPPPGTCENTASQGAPSATTAAAAAAAIKAVRRRHFPLLTDSNSVLTHLD